jgi:hypothetical protein
LCTLAGVHFRAQEQGRMPSWQNQSTSFHFDLLGLVAKLQRQTELAEHRVHPPLHPLVSPPALMSCARLPVCAFVRNFRARKLSCETFVPEALGMGNNL